MSIQRVLQSARLLQQALRSGGVPAVSQLDHRAALATASQLSLRQPLLGQGNLWSRSFTSSTAAHYNGRGSGSSSYYIPTRPPPNYGIRYACTWQPLCSVLHTSMVEEDTEAFSPHSWVHTGLVQGWYMPGAQHRLAWHARSLYMPSSSVRDYLACTTPALT